MIGFLMVSFTVAVVGAVPLLSDLTLSASDDSSMDVEEPLRVFSSVGDGAERTGSLPVSGEVRAGEDLLERLEGAQQSGVLASSCASSDASMSDGFDGGGGGGGGIYRRKRPDSCKVTDGVVRQAPKVPVDHSRNGDDPNKACANVHGQPIFLTCGGPEYLYMYPDLITTIVLDCVPGKFSFFFWSIC